MAEVRCDACLFGTPCEKGCKCECHPQTSEEGSERPDDDGEDVLAELAAEAQKYGLGY